MGLTAIALIYSPWGMRSGAHLNPAVTLSFWRLGKVAPADAAFYIAAQFAGGAAGTLLLAALFGERFTLPPIAAVATLPGSWGEPAAFAAEIAIAFVLMTTVLTNRRVFPADALDRGVRRRAGRAVHRDRGAGLGDEPEPGAQRRLGAAERHLARHLDLPDRAGARHAARRRTSLSGADAAPPAPSCITTVTDTASFTASTRPRPGRATMSHDQYDVIIIGSGAGGGTLAHRLAPSGKRILILERGGFLPREPQNWSSEAVFGANRYKAPETWHDRDGKPFHPGIHYWVGGNTKMYGAVLLRLRERDFGVVHHADGMSPEWPLSYRDLAPYYTEAERLYHVHGQRGSDPTEPPCDDPYPYKAISHEPRIQQLADDLERAGHRPFPLPVGIMLDEEKPQDSACIRCATCDGFPCLVQAKADAHVVCVMPALRHPNVTLLTGAYVERIETNATGSEVSEVVVHRDGEVERYRGDIVVVACGAINSAALLLRSANWAHPDGLANGSGVVGRAITCATTTRR